MIKALRTAFAVGRARSCILLRTMDSPLSLSETSRKIGTNGTLWDNLGNYLALYGTIFFFVSIAQVLASKYYLYTWAYYSSRLHLTVTTVVWDSQRKRAKESKSNRQMNDQRAEEASKIYQAIGKIAKVQMASRM